MTTESMGDAFEADLRAVLRRRAADVADRPDPALPTVGAATRAAPAPRRGAGRSPGQGRGRVVLAVAAGVVLVLAVGAVAFRSGGDDPRAETVAAVHPDQLTSTTDREGRTLDEPADGTQAGAQAAGTRRAVARARAGRPQRSPDSSGAPGSDPTEPTRPGTRPDPDRGPGSGPEATGPPPTTGPGAPQPTVVVDGQGPDRWLRRHCDGTVTPTAFDLAVRVARSGSTSGALTVRLGVSGPLAAPAPATVTFARGSSEASVTLSVPARGSVALVVDVLPGDGYAAGSPSRWRFDDPDPPLRIDCLRPLVATSGGTTQLIRVGQAPAEITFAHDRPDQVAVLLDGSAPPGLTDAPGVGPVLRWEGAATTPGTYTFDVHTCDGDVCDGTAHITITVLAREEEDA